MKVKELIALLEQCDPEAAVVLEVASYDDSCYGRGKGLDVFCDGVYITTHMPDYKPGDTIAQA
jgi:hypothetical protein